MPPHDPRPEEDEGDAVPLTRAAPGWRVGPVAAGPAADAGTVLIGSGTLRVGDVATIARGGAAALAPEAWRRIEAAHDAVERLARGGAAIYGVSTGLGAAVDTPVVPDPSGERQRGIPRARAVGVGRRASAEQVRAMVAARLAGMAAGRSGASRGVAEALLLLLERRVHPVVPLTGSVGEADLAPLAHLACVLAGEGMAEYGGAVLPGTEALARAGITPPRFGAKDGLALVSSNAASVGIAALVLVEAGRVADAALAAAALSFEGYRCGLSPLDPRAAAMRPAPGQADAARRMMALLSGGGLCAPGTARRLQDPVSFRVAASVHGATDTALQAAVAAAEVELNGADDNPAILAEDGPEGAAALPNGNFDPTHLVLALEGLGQAALRAGCCAAGRMMRMMSAESSGLPRFLAPPRDGGNGLATVQKTVAALVAEMQHLAAPMPAALLPVADGVEDYGTMAVAVAEKTGAVVERWRALVAAELLVAAQAVDLRAELHGASRLGDGTRGIQDAVRAVVAPLRADRPTGPDIEALAGAVADGAFRLRG